MLKIPKTIHDRILAHARDEAPKECCGLLAGKNGTAETIYPMTNIHQSPATYMIDPKEQFAVFKEMRAKENDLVAIYHSHPATAAYPSATDVRLAYYPDAVYVIVSLENPAHPVLKAYRIVENKISPEEFKILAS
jgi:[CysO sulfur-carrier protein]-S-L-cysteine hydrolase